MPFSEEFAYRKRHVVGGAPRAINITALGVLSFTVAADHATNVTFYEARIQPEGTSTVVKRIHLGKPWLVSGTTAYYDIYEELSALTPGNYNVQVAAVNEDGETEAAVESNTFQVPLIPE